MLRHEKDAVIAEVAQLLGDSENLFVSDYRGLTMEQLTELRRKLRESGARFKVVKNTLGAIAAGRAVTINWLGSAPGENWACGMAAPRAVATAAAPTLRTVYTITRGAVSAGSGDPSFSTISPMILCSASRANATI